MYKGEGMPFDPEGLTSTLTSIVQVIFGYLVGSYIQQKGKTHEMLSGLFVAGLHTHLYRLCLGHGIPDQQEDLDQLFCIVHHRPRHHGAVCADP